MPSNFQPDCTPAPSRPLLPSGPGLRHQNKMRLRWSGAEGDSRRRGAGPSVSEDRVVTSLRRLSHVLCSPASPAEGEQLDPQNKQGHTFTDTRRIGCMHLSPTWGPPAPPRWRFSPGVFSMRSQVTGGGVHEPQRTPVCWSRDLRPSALLPEIL